MSKNVPAAQQGGAKPAEPPKANAQQNAKAPSNTTIPAAQQQGKAGGGKDQPNQAAAKGQPAAATAQKPGQAVAASAQQSKQANGKQAEPVKPVVQPIDPAIEERKKQKKALMSMQNAYFSEIMHSIQKESAASLKDGSWIVRKLDSGSIKRIEMGHMQLEGILFRKGNMIEDDQVEGKLFEALKERDNLVALLAVAVQSIKDCETQILDFPKTIVQAKKPNIVEEAMIEKRLQDLRKQKDELEKKLLNEEKKVKTLQSQRIDNPKSTYGHPGLQQYLEQQESHKKREANVFVKKLQEEKKVSEIKKQRYEQEQQQKQLQEEQDKLAKEARIKIQKEKEKEENLKERIKEIAQEKVKRVQEFESHQEKYKQQTEKMNNGKTPLYMRLSKEFRSQQKLETEQQSKHMDEVRESHKRIDEMNLFEHQQKYLDKLKTQEETRANEQKKMKALMKDHLAKLASFPQSTMWNLSKEEVLANTPQDNKLRAQKQIEARKMFAKGVFQKNFVKTDKQKNLELEIQIDKLKNPAKYVKPLKRRRNSTDSKYEASEEYDNFDEKIFKKQLNFERGQNNQYDKGKEYLEEVKEKVKNLPRKAKSEYPLSLEDSKSENAKNVASTSQLNQSIAKTKIDYMSEVRSKFNLDKKNEMKEWERVSKSYNYSDPNEKKNNLLRISKKLDDEAKHQELMYNIQKSNKQGVFSIGDVESREKIDEMYLESIKAKFAIFDQYNSAPNQQQHQQQQQHDTELESETHSQR